MSRAERARHFDNEEFYGAGETEALIGFRNRRHNQTNDTEPPMPTSDKGVAAA